MTFALYITFLCIFSLTTWVIGNTIYHRKRISCMVGMMIAMSLGMMVGLTTGVILGVLFSGNLFFSTVLGITIGIIVGFLSGLPISLMAVLDGSLAGMMGGMMGVMLGEMIMPQYQESIIRLIFLLFVALILILFAMMKEEFMKKNKTIFANQATVLSLFIFFIIGYSQLDPLIASSNHPNPNRMNMVMNTNNLVIQANEFSFSTNKIKIPAGEGGTLVLHNIGEVEHTFELVKVKTETIIPLSSEDKRINVHSMPGEQQKVSFTPMKPGIYYYACTIPGHAELGMKGTIEVTTQHHEADQLMTN